MNSLENVNFPLEIVVNQPSNCIFNQPRKHPFLKFSFSTFLKSDFTRNCYLFRGEWPKNYIFQDRILSVPSLCCRLFDVNKCSFKKGIFCYKANWLPNRPLGLVQILTGSFYSTVRECVLVD